MISSKLIYCIGILDNAIHLFGGLAFISCIIAITFFVCILTEMDTGKITYAMKRRYLTLSLLSFVIFSSLYTFTPSSKLAAAMYVVPAVANNENVQAIGSNSFEALRKLTEQWLRELDDGKQQGKESKILDNSSI